MKTTSSEKLGMLYRATHRLFNGCLVIEAQTEDGRSYRMLGAKWHEANDEPNSWDGEPTALDDDEISMVAISERSGRIKPIVVFDANEAAAQLAAALKEMPEED